MTASAEAAGWTNIPSRRSMAARCGCIRAKPGLGLAELRARVLELTNGTFKSAVYSENVGVADRAYEPKPLQQESRPMPSTVPSLVPCGSRVQTALLEREMARLAAC